MKNQMLIIATLGAMLCGVAGAAGTAPKTLANLNAAFTGETQASQRYTRFAAKAKQDGEMEAARLFEAAAKAESIHARKHLKTIESLGGKAPEVAADETVAGSTADNLKAAIKGENHEREAMYPGFIATAKEEGAKAAVKSFDWAMEAETEHAKLYAAVAERLGKKSDAGFAVCPKCGFTVTLADLGKLQECPVCEGDGADFSKF